MAVVSHLFLFFKDINLYENHLSNAFVDIALKGRQISVENSCLLADDLSTGGMFHKAWIRGSRADFIF